MNKEICKTCKWRHKNKEWHLRNHYRITENGCNLKRFKRWNNG